jgi:translation initiation factor IF-2
MPSTEQKKPGTLPGRQVPRPPVVVIMGHIDHGKSTLLDYIRKSNIVAGEAGGITQHVGAYQVDHTTAEGTTGSITFLDTPGHAAFTSIRERGARAADIAILVVSAEDGVKPQTLEALRNIRESKLPFIVAITKTDKPNANVDKAMQSLGENEVYVEGWGGDTPVVPVSAVTGAGISELLDTIILLAELTGFTADLDAPAAGVIIESTLDARKGISVTLLLKNGTLTVGSVLVAGKALAPVRFIENFKGEKIEKALPSMPIRIIGWSEIPPAGMDFIVVKNKKEAERLTQEYATELKRTAQAKVPPLSPAPSPSTAGTVTTTPGAPEAEPVKVVTIPLIIKADVIGSLEGIKHELAKITHDKVKLKIVSEGIGDINENDIKSAQSDPAIIVVGFNAPPDKKAAPMIDRLGTAVKTFTIIYELSEFVHQTLLSKVPKEYIEEMTGRAQILALFSKEKDRQVIGGKVESGTIGNGNDVRIMRRQAEIGRGRIRELQTKKQRTQEVAEGHKFGMLVEAKVEIAPGDRIEAVRTVEKHNI